jgi:FxLD family lantipeptide
MRRGGNTMTMTLGALDLGDAAIDDIDGIGDSEFEFDLRVVESTTKVTIAMCDTNDGCGNTCQGSACVSVSNDPY